MIFFFWLTVSDVCITSLIKVIFSMLDNCTLFKSNSEINFFNFLNSFFFINFELTMIFAETVNLTLIKIKVQMNSNHWSFWSVYINHSLFSSNFKNLILKYSVFIFVIPALWPLDHAPKSMTKPKVPGFSSEWYIKQHWCGHT